VNLVGLHEIANMLNVSRQRADQLARQTGFPKPLDTVKAGRIWKRDAVEKWQRERETARAARYAG
jgi:predicted DNA-binding transcriptional regulator AlpA